MRSSRNHSKAGFSDTANLPASSEAVNLFALLGEEAGCRQLAEAFYSRVPQDAVLRAVYSPSFHCAIDSLSAFFVQFFGGPCIYAQQRWSLSLREAHLRFKIGPRERDAWMRNIQRAMEDLQIAEPVRVALHQFFAEASTLLINQREGGREETCPQIDLEGSTMHATDSVQQEVAARWSELRTLEEIVAAARRGDAKQTIALTESAPMQRYFVRDSGAYLSLLALLCSSANADLLDYVCRKVMEEPTLVQERYTYGRTLLHDAAGEGCLPIMTLLLHLGADPNACDRGGHTPLYFVGNQCSAADGEKVVPLLVQAGAQINAEDSIKRCTALHMAARRGNISVGAALLECGANIEAQDRHGDTPLRRAVNCGKAEMAAFLLAHHADPHSVGSRGLTPQQAARGSAMKQILQSYGAQVDTEGMP